MGKLLSFRKTAKIFLASSVLLLNISASIASSREQRWHLQRIVQRERLSKQQLQTGARSFNLSTIKKQRVNVYIIDSGIRITHKEFARDQAIYGVNIQRPGSLPSDCDGHGTHVAGIVGGSISGIADNARLIAVKVLNCRGKGTCSDMLSGLEWVAVDHEARRKTGERSAAVMSIGSTNDECRSTIQATQKLWDAGIIITAAAGNTKSDACDLYPAGNPRTIAVGATDNLDRVFTKNNFGDCIDLFGPGVDVLSAWGLEADDEWKEISGSSMAAPQVAGVVAVILGADPTLSSTDVRQIILSSASKNRILQTDGDTIMTASVNRLLYAPWTKLFDEVKMNERDEARTASVMRQEGDFPVEDVDWNSSSSFVSLSLSLKPKTSPAMYYAVVRISSAIASVTGVRFSSILPRRAADVQVSAEGEPEVVALVFYIPVLPPLVEMYTKRLLAAYENGELLSRSREEIKFGQGSMEGALLVNVTVPKADTDESSGDDGVSEEERSSVKIIVIVIGSAIGLGVIIGLIVLLGIPRFTRARNHRQAVMAARQNNEVTLPEVNDSPA